MYLKENVEILFMSLISDVNGDKTNEIMRKMSELYDGNWLFNYDSKIIS